MTGEGVDGWLEGLTHRSAGAAPVLDIRERPIVSHSPSAPPVHTAPMLGRTVLSARGLVKRRGDTLSLDHASIDIAAGESVAVMGASGSGKTTLLHCLAGIIVPDEGSVRFQSDAESIEVPRLSDARRSRLRRESFGFVFQQGFLLPELTAIENVALPLMLAGTRRAAAHAEAARWFGPLGLEGLQSRRIGVSGSTSRPVRSIRRPPTR